jgi:hypothetical protein
MRSRRHMVLIVSVLLSMVVVPSVLAQTAAAPKANEKMTFEETARVDPEWPTVADNQDQAPRARKIITNGPPVDIACFNPCVGGTGCTNWESVDNSYCRSTGGTTYDCSGSSGTQYCMKKTLSSGLVSCKTCFYE